MKKDLDFARIIKPEIMNVTVKKKIKYNKYQTSSGSAVTLLIITLPVSLIKEDYVPEGISPCVSKRELQ